MKNYMERKHILDKAFLIAFDGEVSIYQNSITKEWQVNWSALGNVSTEKTMEFISKLGVAMDIADTLNIHEMEFTYTDNGDPEIGEEEFQEVVERVTKWLKEKTYRNAENVEQWLLDGAYLYEAREDE